MTRDEHPAENAAWDRAARDSYSVDEIRKIPGPEGLSREEWLARHLREAFREGYKVAVSDRAKGPTEMVRLPDGSIARVSTIARVFTAGAVNGGTLGDWPPRTIVMYADGNATVIEHKTLAEAIECRDLIAEMLGVG